MSFGTAPEGVDGALAAAHSDASFFAFGVVMIVIGVCALAVGGLVVRLLLAKGAGSNGRRLADPERGDHGGPPPVDGPSGRGSGTG